MRGFLIAAAVTAAAMVGSTVAVSSAGAVTIVDPAADRYPSCASVPSEDDGADDLVPVAIPYPCGFDCATMGNGLCEAGKLGTVARRQ